MHRPNLSNIVLCATLFALVLSPSTLSTRAVTAYLPSVTPGQFAQYKVLKDSCHSSILQICQSLGTSLNDTTYAAVQVVGVSGTAVTLQLVSIFKNGTGEHAGALVDVATGVSNVPAFSLGARDYFLLAGALAAPDKIWNTLSAPTLNKTINEMVLGASRSVNFLNYSMSGSYLGVRYLEFDGFAFDQSSGFLVQINFSLRTIITGIAELDFVIVMVDNNVWRNAHMPDFGLSADPTSVSIVGDTSGNSAITLQRLYGFSATVKLSATASGSGISCSFSASSLPMGGSDTSVLSCRGFPGTYTVRVDGNGGYSVHNTSITVTLSATPLFAELISVLSMPLVYGGIGVAAVVTALASFLFLRRKPRAAGITPGDTSTPSTQA